MLVLHDPQGEMWKDGRCLVGIPEKPMAGSSLVITCKFLLSLEGPTDQLGPSALAKEDFRL